MPWLTVGVIAGSAVLLAAVGFWWWWPKRQADRLRLTIRDPKARADVEDNLRKTIGQLLGGAAVLIGGALAYLQFSQQQQTSQQQFSRQQQASHDLLISNQVSKGFEQLGSDRVVVRLGGIYALEGVMNTSEQYHRPVLEALSAFVRDGTRTETGDGPPAIDIQAALTVIGRRVGPDLTATHIPMADLRADFVTGRPDLTAAHIPMADLAFGHLSRARLRGADLSGANLFGADLSSAYLSVANLGGANLLGADLSHADLSYAKLSHANLFGANVNGANVSYADLSHAVLSHAKLSHADLSVTNLGDVDLSAADLRGASLPGANLRGADLRYADLSDADLSAADLSAADLTNAIVSQTRLQFACGIDVKLASSLTVKPCK